MLDSSNRLNGNYHRNFLTHEIREAVRQLPGERRKTLAEEIQTRAAIMGCKDPVALKKALELLRKEDKLK